MNEFYFTEQLLLRSPSRHWRQYLLDEQQQLNDLDLRSAIYVASPQFYACLEQKEFNYERLTVKEKLTLRKYFNRSCFRAVPFGLFAGVSLLQWGEHYGIDLPKTKPSDVKLFPDQGWVAAMSKDLLKRELYEYCRYETNPTLYQLADEYRFISSEVEPDRNARKYLLQATEYTPILQELSHYCRSPRSSAEVVNKICELAGCSVEIGDDYHHFLRGEQFLVEEWRPTITGSEHIASLLTLPDLARNNAARTLKLRQLLHYAKNDSFLDPAQFREINDRFSALTVTPSDRSGANNLYVILNRNLTNNTVPEEHQQKIRDAIFALDCLSQEETIPALTQFIRVFQKEFEGQTLPLLFALDPEIGIGYYAEERPAIPLLETLHFTEFQADDRSLNWTDTHRYLLNKWHASVLSQPVVIALDEDELQSMARDKKSSGLLGLSVLYRIAGEELYLESAGGVNAPALIGRFTIADESIKDAARKMARDLETENPDVIFAELLHLSGTHTDNINRRETIWSYEIPITAASALPEENQVRLEDLRVKISNGMLVLFSEKHRKIVIPRLTSAYNHTIDKLPLFRFLVDVAYQYGKFSFGLDLRQFFPGLNYYPRVTFKKSILHLATWVLNESQIKLLSELSETHQSALHTQIRKLGLPRIFSLIEGDQQLVFFREKAHDVLFFVECVSQKQEAVIKEFLLEDGDELTTHQEDRPDFTFQFNACLLPKQSLQLPAPGTLQSKETKAVRRLLPGSEWLYLKIYTSRNSSGKLLLKILPLLRRRYGGRPIKSWFFVRYEDHAPHIRLRIQMAPKDISFLLIAFKKALEDGVSQHVIREYQIDVYNRELERYDAGGIRLTESFFWISSEMAIRFLKSHEMDAVLPVEDLTIRSTWDIIAVFLPEMSARIAFTEKCYRQFLSEFEGKRMKIELDQKYRAMSPNIRRLITDQSFYRLSGIFMTGKKFIRSLNKLSKSIFPQDQKIEFLQSIIHMHLNRLFATDPRKQELVIYYLLYKFLISEDARTRRNNVS